MKKQIGFGLGVALSLSLVGCLFGGDGDKVSSSSSAGQIVTPGVAPIRLTTNFQNKIQIDEVSRIIQYANYECDSNANVSMVWDTNYYQLNSGSLLVWHSYSCYATQYVGKNSNIYGTWTVSKGAVEQDIPSTFQKSASCFTNSQTRDTSHFDLISVNYAKDLFSLTRIGDYCWADRKSGSNPSTDCHQYLDTIKTSTGVRIGKYTLLQYNTSTGARRYTLEYNGQTCEYNSLNTPIVPREITTEQCQQAVASYKADTTKYKYFYYDTYIKKSMGIVSPYASFDSCQVKIGYQDQLNR